MYQHPVDDLSLATAVLSLPPKDLAISATVLVGRMLLCSF